MEPFDPERCYVCKKPFCCQECCDNHISNRHPNSKSRCPLCHNVALRIRNFDDSEFLMHIVFNHLPLHCRTCGVVFENLTDLKNISKCIKHPLIIIEPPTCIESSESSLPMNSPPVSLGGESSRQISLIDKTGLSISGDSNCNINNFSSPPEISRTTSTPLHISVLTKNYNFQQTKKVANIFSTPSFLSSNDSNKNDISIVTPSSKLNDAESNYYSAGSSMKLNLSDKTALKSILLNKSTSSEINYQQNSKNLSGKKLESMEELDENEVNMDLTDTHGGICAENTTPPITKNVSEDQEIKSSGKKVRFIDECEVKTQLDNTKFDASEVEEFFEAQQSLGDVSFGVAESLNVNNSVAVFDDEKLKSLEKEIIDDDKKMSENNEPIKNQETKSKSTSRIVMMVLVEQTGDDYSTDLAPLIDSSLKKLQSALMKTPLTRNLPAGISEEKLKTNGKFSLVSVDSYSSVSTIECFKASDLESIPEKNQPTTSNINLGAGGIFSTVANAVKNAFKNWAGISSTKNTPQAESSKEISQLTSLSIPSSTKNTTEATSSEEISRLSSLTMPFDKSPQINSNSTIISSSRPTKRSRDDSDSSPSDSPDAFGTDTNGSRDQNDIRSPLHKRPRGWYGQIRGREPIARMKNLYTSPRGISSEKQCFQQGSLTVGDKILPLPSRAHQSTQTD